MTKAPDQDDDDFRRSHGQPYVEIRSIADLLAVAQPDLWWRGQEQDWKPEPGALRPDFRKEAASFEGNLETELLKEWERRFRPMHHRDATPVEVYFEAQHHGLPTRLLDWSESPLVALYFATKDALTEDGVVYGYDPLSYSAAGWPGPVFQRHVQTQSVIRPIMNYPPLVPAPVPGPIPIRPDVAPGRIAQQGSVFTLHPDDVPIRLAHTAIVPGEAKQGIQAELSRAGLTQVFLFPDPDNLAGWLKRRFHLGVSTETC